MDGIWKGSSGSFKSWVAGNVESKGGRGLFRVLRNAACMRAIETWGQRMEAIVELGAVEEQRKRCLAELVGVMCIVKLLLDYCFQIA